MKHKDFIRAIRDLSGRRHTWQVFSDFCEMAAIALTNSVLIGEAHEKREADYLAIASRYDAEEMAGFSSLLGITVMALEERVDDFLGHVFMDLELSNHWKGQYFTPFALSTAMAQLTISEDVATTIENQGFVRVHEPACGSGSMVMAFAEELRTMGYNPQHQLYAECIDVDSTAAHMAVIQLSLMHIPATIIVGNSLSMEFRDTFHTPAYVLGFWDSKLRGHYTTQPESETPEVVSEPVQLGLFMGIAA